MDQSQSALVNGIKNRDTHAYETMLDMYTKVIYYLAYNILHQSATKEDIEECVADVFLDAWTKIDDFDGDKGNFRTWLLMLTKYKALSYKRRLSSKSSVSLDDYDLRDDYNLESHVLSRQDQGIVLKTINDFNSLDRAIFVRRYLFGEAISSLVKNLNLSRPAIDNRLFRGRKKIKEVLKRG